MTDDQGDLYKVLLNSLTIFHCNNKHKVKEKFFDQLFTAKIVPINYDLAKNLKDRPLKF